MILYLYKWLKFQKCSLQYSFIWFFKGQSWSWSYGSWIYNYLCNQCLSPLKLWLRILVMVRCTWYCTTLCYKVCQWLPTGRLFSPGTPVSSTNKTDCHDRTEILLKVALNTITLTLTSMILQITNVSKMTSSFNISKISLYCYKKNSQ
jgi:hypothetical protein